MIRMSRFVERNIRSVGAFENKLELLHRMVFLDCDDVTQEQGDRIGELLRQIERGKADMPIISCRKVLPGENVCSEIHCTHVVTCIWNVLDGEEVSLFSSWKTKVNIVCMEVLGKKAVGFADISKEGINLYQ